MKKRFHKQSALLVFGLLLLGMSLACFVWVRKEQRQYKLNRDLIAALLKKDTKQALVLVEAGADPNTRVEPSPAPSLSTLMKQILHPAPPQASTSTTAFSIACGSDFASPQGSKTEPVYRLSPLDSHLTQAMLLHGAKMNNKDSNGFTTLHIAVTFALYGLPAEYETNKEIVAQLLANGADPDAIDNSVPEVIGKTPMQTALAAASSSELSRPDLVALLRKYRQHP